MTTPIINVGRRGGGGGERKHLGISLSVAQSIPTMDAKSQVYSCLVRSERYLIGK